MDGYSYHTAAPDGTAAKPAPKDMSHHYSDVTKARKPSSMKKFYKFFDISGIGNFAGGLYTPDCPSLWRCTLRANRPVQAFLTLNSSPLIRWRLRPQTQKDGHPRPTALGATMLPLLRLWLEQRYHHRHLVM